MSDAERFEQQIRRNVEAAAAAHEAKARDLRDRVAYAYTAEFEAGVPAADVAGARAWYLVQRLLADAGVSVGVCADPAAEAVRALACLEAARAKGA